MRNDVRRSRIAGVGIPAGLKRRLLGGGLALALGASMAVPAARADSLLPLNPFITMAGSGEGESELARFLLPYSPTVFDLVVAFTRSLVTITYDSRGYDPLTQTFVLQGLKIGRGDFEAAARRIRIGATTSIYEGISVDTRRLTLEPQFREALQRLGIEVVSGDIAVTVSSDTPSASYDFDVVADVDRIGKVSFSAGVSGFHVLVPLDRAMEDIDGDGDGDALQDMTADGKPLVVGTLRHATVSFDNAGVAEAAFAFAKEAQNLSKEEVQGLVGSTIAPVFESLFQTLPGGASPELERRATEWSATVQAFVADPRHLEITFRPATPFDLSQLGKGPVTAAEIEALNPAVSRTAIDLPYLVSPTATADEDGGVPMSRRLVEGYGVPQNVAAGVALALGDALAGDAQAGEIAVRGLVLDPEAGIGLENPADAYALLLLAKARGSHVPESVLAAFADRLPAETVAAGEDKALAQWTETDVGRAARGQLEADVAAFDWSAIRKAAYDFYEGDRAPRNLTEAYALAQVAAAGGDRIAAELRDRLRAGNTEKRILFPIETGQAKADALWRVVLAAAAPPGEAAPAGPDGTEAAPAEQDGTQAAPAPEDDTEATPEESDGMEAAPDASGETGEAPSEPDGETAPADPASP